MGFAGKVEDFDGTTQPLTLAAGTHRDRSAGAGYEPMLSTWISNRDRSSRTGGT